MERVGAEIGENNTLQKKTKKNLLRFDYSLGKARNMFCKGVFVSMFTHALFTIGHSRTLFWLSSFELIIPFVSEQIS